MLEVGLELKQKKGLNKLLIEISLTNFISIKFYFIWMYFHLHADMKC